MERGASDPNPLDRQNSGVDYHQMVLQKDPTFFPAAKTIRNMNNITSSSFRSLSNPLLQGPKVNEDITSFEEDFFWNENFQRVIEKPTSTPEEGVQRHNDIHKLSKALAEVAKPVVKKIIEELNLKAEQRTIKPVEVGGVAGGRKYIHKHMFLKFATDTSDDKSLYGREEYAAKAAGHELKSMNAIISTNQRTLHIPLTCIINYRGYRLIVMALLPIDSASLIYGSRDAGKNIKTNPEIDHLLHRVAGFLNLKSHEVQARDTKEVKLIHTAVDVECHRGYDGRYYLLDLARLLPPEYPVPKVPGCILHRMLRAEFVKRYEVPLSSDACGGFGKLERDKNDLEVMQASDKLQSVLLHELVEALKAEYTHLLTEDKYSYDEGRIKKIFHNHGVNMRFLARVLQFMFISPRLLTEERSGASFTSSSSLIATAVQYEPMPEVAHNPEGSSNSIFTEGSSNSLFAGYEDEALQPSDSRSIGSSPNTSHTGDTKVRDGIVNDLAVEIGARLFRAILNNVLRNPTKGGTDVAFFALTAEYVSLFVGSASEFWITNVKDTLIRKYVDGFGRFPDDHRSLERFLLKDTYIEKAVKSQRFNLMIRIQSLTGIIFKPNTFSKMLEEANFFDQEDPIRAEHIKEITATEKHLHLVPFVEVLAQAAQYEQAEKHFQKELESRRALGADHPQVARILAHMAELYTTYPGKAEKAIECFFEAIRILSSKMGDEDMEVVYMKEQLASFYSKTARFPLAEKILLATLEVKLKLLQPNDSEIALTYDSIAWVCQNLGRHPEAHAYYKKAIAIHEQQDLGTSSEALARALNNMGTLLHAMGKTDEAIGYADRALEVLETSRGIHSEVAVACENLARLQAAKGKYVAAERGYKRALDINQKTLGEAHVSVASTHDNMGQLYAMQGNFPLAESNYKNALSIYEKNGEAQGTGAAITLYNLGKLYSQMHDRQKAAQKLREALEIFRHNLGTAHHYFENAQKALSEVNENSLHHSASRLVTPGHLNLAAAGFNIERVSPAWKQILRNAGISPKDLADINVARTLFRVIQANMQPDRSYEAAVSSPRDASITPRPAGARNTVNPPPKNLKFRVQKVFRRARHRVSRVFAEGLANVRRDRTATMADADAPGFLRATSDHVQPQEVAFVETGRPMLSRSRATTAPPGFLTKSMINLMAELDAKEQKRLHDMMSASSGNIRASKESNNLNSSINNNNRGQLGDSKEFENRRKEVAEKRSSRRRSRKEDPKRKFDEYVNNALNQLIVEDIRKKFEDEEEEEGVLPDISHLNVLDKDKLTQLLAESMKALREYTDIVRPTPGDDWED